MRLLLLVRQHRRGHHAAPARRGARHHLRGGDHAHAPVLPSNRLPLRLLLDHARAPRLDPSDKPVCGVLPCNDPEDAAQLHAHVPPRRGRGHRHRGLRPRDRQQLCGLHPTQVHTPDRRRDEQHRHAAHLHAACKGQLVHVVGEAGSGDAGSLRGRIHLHQLLDQEPSGPRRDDLPAGEHERHLRIRPDHAEPAANIERTPYRHDRRRPGALWSPGAGRAPHLPRHDHDARQGREAGAHARLRVHERDHAHLHAADRQQLHGRRDASGRPRGGHPPASATPSPRSATRTW